MRAFREIGLTGFLQRFVPVIAVVAAFVFLTTAPTLADHLEGNQQALGEPEHLLSGIDVRNSTIAEIIKIYGEPTSKRDIPAEGVRDGVGGERNYIWESNGLKFGVWTGYHNEKESGINSVDVWGNAAKGVLGMTGRGLSLGSTIQQQKTIYGDRFFVSSTFGKMLPSGPDPRGTVKSVLLEWRDGTQMVIDYDSNGHISHMQLSADIE